MKISQEVLEVLSALEVNGKAVKIVAQLDRKLYQAVNKVLEECGGKWNRGARAHLFEEDPAERLGEVINSGEIVTAASLGYFPTPQPLAAHVVGLADIRPGHRVLEPSAGMGAIAKEAQQAGGEVLCVEVDPRRAETLRRLELSPVVTDFLTYHAPGEFDRIVMNPPFYKQADIEHVRHADSMLKHGGRLVAIMGAGTRFRQDRKATEFRAWVDALGGKFKNLPEGSFRESGTGVNACVLVINKPGTLFGLKPMRYSDPGIQSPLPGLSNLAGGDEPGQALKTETQLDAEALAEEQEMGRKLRAGARQEERVAGRDAAKRGEHCLATRAKCPACNAKMDFNPTGPGWRCPGCLTVHPVELHPDGTETAGEHYAKQTPEARAAAWALIERTGSKAAKKPASANLSAALDAPPLVSPAGEERRPEKKAAPRPEQLSLF